VLGCELKIANLANSGSKKIGPNISCWISRFAALQKDPMSLDEIVIRVPSVRKIRLPSCCFQEKPSSEFKRTPGTTQRTTK